MMTNTKYTAVVVALILAVSFAGGAVTYAQFSDTETATGSFTAGTWTTTPTETTSKMSTEGIVGSSNQNGLRFVAFCVADNSSGSVTIMDRTKKAVDGSIQITYSHTFNDLKKVVNKIGPDLYADKSPDGVVFSGEAEPVAEPSGPVCSESAITIKFEEDAGELKPSTSKSSGNLLSTNQINTMNGQSVTKTGIQVSTAKTNGTAGGAFEGQSTGNTSDTTVSTNNSTATPSPTPTETTVKTSPTTTETVTKTPETGTPTPISTSTPTTTTMSNATTTENTSATATGDEVDQS